MTKEAKTIEVREPLPWQRTALAIPDQYDLLLAGGRGGGKTVLLEMLIVRDVIRFGSAFVGALVRRELAGLRKIEQELAVQIESIPELQGSRFIASKKEYRFTNGAILFLHYLRDENAYGRFQGVDLSHVYIDESGQIPDPAPVLRLRSSMRSTHQGVSPRMCLSCNPNNQGSHWHFDFFISKMVPWRPQFIELFRKEVVLVQSTLFDNHHIVDRDGYVESLRASCNFDEARIQSEVYGSWSTTSGAFFGAVWDVNRIKLPSIGGLPVKDAGFDPRDCWLAADWGSKAPASIVLAYRMPRPGWWGGRQIAAGSLICVDELYSCAKSPDGTPLWNQGARRTTTEIASLVGEMVWRNGIHIDDIPVRQRIADAAIGADLGSRDGSIGNQLKAAGCAFTAGPKGRRSTGWQLMASMFEAAGSPDAPGLYATTSCQSIFHTIPTLVHASTDPEDIDTTGVDHTADALRYLVCAMRDPRYTGRACVLDGRNGRPMVRVW